MHIKQSENKPWSFASRECSCASQLEYLRISPSGVVGRVAVHLQRNVGCFKRHQNRVSQIHGHNVCFYRDTYSQINGCNVCFYRDTYLPIMYADSTCTYMYVHTWSYTYTYTHVLSSVDLILFVQALAVFKAEREEYLDMSKYLIFSGLLCRSKGSCRLVWCLQDKELRFQHPPLLPCYHIPVTTACHQLFPCWKSSPPPTLFFVILRFFLIIFFL